MTLYNVKTIDDDLIQISTNPCTTSLRAARLIIVRYNEHEYGSEEANVDVSMDNLKTLYCFLELIFKERMNNDC
jgi:hypothetical protein